jgi:hypothetical protein
VEDGYALTNLGSDRVDPLERGGLVLAMLSCGAGLTGPYRVGSGRRPEPARWGLVRDVQPRFLAASPSGDVAVSGEEHVGMLSQCHRRMVAPSGCWTSMGWSTAPARWGGAVHRAPDASTPTAFRTSSPGRPQLVVRIRRLLPLLAVHWATSWIDVGTEDLERAFGLPALPYAYRADPSRLIHSRHTAALVRVAR